MGKDTDSCHWPVFCHASWPRPRRRLGSATRWKLIVYALIGYNSCWPLKPSSLHDFARVAGRDDGSGRAGLRSARFVSRFAIALANRRDHCRLVRIQNGMSSRSANERGVSSPVGGGASDSGGPSTSGASLLTPADSIRGFVGVIDLVTS